MLRTKFRMTAILLLGLGMLPDAGTLQAVTVSYDGQFVLFSGGGKMVRVGPAGAGILAYPSFGDLSYTPRNYAVSVTPSYSQVGGLDFADFSGDAQTTVWSGSQFCYNRVSVCLTRSQKYSSIQTPDGQSRIFLGGARLSSNGRYMLIGNAYSSGYVYVQNLQAQTTSTQNSISHGPCKIMESDWNGRQVANNGSAICLDKDPGDTNPGLVLVKEGSFDIITPSTQVQYAAIDGSGTSAIYALNNKLYRYDILSKKTDLIYGTGDFVFGLQLSDDGKTALLLLSADTTGNVIYTIAFTMPSGQVRRLAFPMDRSPCFLSGDGKIAMCSTDDDEIYRVDLLTGKATDVPWRPALVKINSGVPGSAANLNGIGFPNLVSPPENGSVWELEGTRVFIGGYPAPILTSYFYNYLTVQVPWELSAQAGQRIPILIDAGNGHRAEGLFDVLPPQIVFAKTDLGEIQSNRQNTNIEVGTNTPAIPGDIVSMYATGLGPVDKPMPTGQVGPAGPFAHTTLPVTCGTGTSLDSLEVYYSGMTPNEAGTYRIVLKVPVDAKASYPITSSAASFDFGFRCKLGDGDPAFGQLNVKIVK